MKKIWWLAGALFAFDRLSKLWAEHALAPGGTRAVWPNILQFTYAHNTGAGFSMLTGNNTTLTLINSILLILVLAVYIKGKSLPAPMRAGLIFYLLGGLSNVADRLIYGYVIDFIELLFIRFAVFNMADMMVTTGAALCAIGLLIPRKEATRT